MPGSKVRKLHPGLRSRSPELTDNLGFDATGKGLARIVRRVETTMTASTPSVEMIEPPEAPQPRLRVACKSASVDLKTLY